MKLKCAHQGFGLGYKAKKKKNDYFAKIKKKARMIKIEG
jgi:hypothetical protein